MMDTLKKINELAFLSSKLGAANRSLQQPRMTELHPEESKAVNDALVSIESKLRTLRAELHTKEVQE